MSKNERLDNERFSLIYKFANRQLILSETYICETDLKIPIDYQGVMRTFLPNFRKNIGKDKKITLFEG
jgi:hypothetical protein